MDNLSVVMIAFKNFNKFLDKLINKENQMVLSNAKNIDENRIYLSSRG